MPEAPPAPTRPLHGLRVLELGQVLAGPFCGAILAWFGAEVIKVEPPKGGDPLRTWRHIEDGTSLWWYILGRNKKSITADLRQEAGRDLVRKLIARSDVVIENFRPGRMEEWGLGPDDIAKLNPRTILARVSGYGQTGPYAPKPGYASVAEGYGGLRYLTGFPDRPPARANLSLGDSIAGLHAALGILTAVYHRDVNGGAGPGRGRGDRRRHLQPDGIGGARVHERGPRARAPRLEGVGHRAEQHVSLRRREVHHHRRQRRQHLQAADARRRAGRSRRGSARGAQRRPRAARSRDRCRRSRRGRASTPSTSC